MDYQDVDDAVVRAVRDYNLGLDLLDKFKPSDTLYMIRGSVKEAVLDGYVENFDEEYIASVWIDDATSWLSHLNREQRLAWFCDIRYDFWDDAIMLGCTTPQEHQLLLEAFSPRCGPKRTRLRKAADKLIGIVACWLRHNRRDVDFLGLSDFEVAGMSIDDLGGYVEMDDYVDAMVQEIGVDKVADYLVQRGIDLSEYRWMKGCFYGPHHNDTWDYAESCFDTPPGGWWRLYQNRRGVLQVINATQHHVNFLAALREIFQQYPELPDAIEFNGPVESVAALLAKPKQRIQDVVFLHGTTDAFLDDILTNGLRPRSETNVCPTYGAKYSAPPGRCDWVYLTTQHNIAAMAARDAVRQHGGAGIILAVGPGLRESYAEIDEDAAAFTAEESLATLGNIAYRRTIQPQLIRVHEKLVNQTTWQKVGSTMLRSALYESEFVEISPRWVQSVNKWWKKQVRTALSLVDQGQGADSRPYVQAITSLREALSAFAQDFFLVRGMWQPADAKPFSKTSPTKSADPVAINKKIKTDLATIDENLRAGVDFIVWLERHPPDLMDKRDLAWRDYDQNLDHYQMRYLASKWKHRATENIKNVDSLFSRNVLGSITRWLNAAGFSNDLPLSHIRRPREREVGKVKIIMQDIRSLYPRYTPEGERDPISIEVIARIAQQVRNTLERKQLDHLWYGDIYVWPTTAGWNVQQGPLKDSKVAGDYYYRNDAIRIYAAKYTGMDDLLIHELAHRHWYKFMSQVQRAEFAAWFGKVQPITLYSTTNPEEEFAETFAAYVAGRELTRDQLERFRRFVEKKIKTAVRQKVGSTMRRTALVQQELSWLKRYLTMSDANKGRDLATRFPEELAQWLLDELYGTVVTTEGDDVDDVVTAIEAERYDVLDNLTNVVAEAFLRSADRNDRLSASPDTPSYFFFDYRGIVKNQWLIHFTNYAFDVVRDGFAVGVDDLSRLGLTVFLNKQAKPGGYNFAYTLDAFERYGRRLREDSWRYGRDAVLFRASGLELWHHGDEEPQVIFWGPSARDRILLMQSYYYEWDAQYKERVETNGWIVDACDDVNTLFGAEKLTTVVDWVVHNFDQYRNKLVC